MDNPITAGESDGVDSGLYGDVAALLDGSLPEPPSPSILRRSDGHSLFYSGEVNVVFGDPEHGKTWVVQAGATEVLVGRGAGAVSRPRPQRDERHGGETADAGRAQGGAGRPQPVPLLRAAQRRRGDGGAAHCQAWTPEMAVIDSTGELMPLFGRSSDSGDDFTDVHNAVLQPLADTGAAVAVVDHLAKNSNPAASAPVARWPSAAPSGVCRCGWYG